MGADYSKQLKSIIAAAEAAGWTVTKTANGHWQLVPPNLDAAIVHAPGTSSAARAVENLVADLRRSGLAI